MTRHGHEGGQIHVSTAAVPRMVVNGHDQTIEGIINEEALFVDLAIMHKSRDDR